MRQNVDPGGNRRDDTQTTAARSNTRARARRVDHTWRRSHRSASSLNDDNDQKSGGISQERAAQHSRCRRHRRRQRLARSKRAHAARRMNSRAPRVKLAPALEHTDERATARNGRRRALSACARRA